MFWTLACSDPLVKTDKIHPTAADLMPVEEGKADGYRFTINHLMTDDVFEDSEFLSVGDIQAFLAESPYGHRSFLADYRRGGRSVADTLVDAAQRYEVNPLVLLVKLQVESSLVFNREAPSSFVVDRAMGCGCHDGDISCHRGELGLFPQIDCAARLFRRYMDAMANGEETAGGWKVGKPRQSSDDIRIVPANRATAALYTYTPWVLHGTGGNWLYWNVMRRFSRQLLDGKPNHRWIGGTCSSDDDCGYADAFCTDGVGDPHGSMGICTRLCDGLCPDSLQPYTNATFCTEGAAVGMPELVGVCVSRCALSDRMASCEQGFECRAVDRFNDSDAQYAGCVRALDPDDSEESETTE